MIGQDGHTITGVLTTPEAVYNRVTKFISGNGNIEFESLQCTAKGVGFDMSQLSKTLHIRKDVRLNLKTTEGVDSMSAVTAKTDSDKKKDQSQDLGNKVDIPRYR